MTRWRRRYLGGVRPATTITILILLALILLAGVALVVSLRGA